MGKNVVSHICQDTCHHTQPSVSQKSWERRLLPHFTQRKLRHGVEQSTLPKTSASAASHMLRSGSDFSFLCL